VPVTRWPAAALLVLLVACGSDADPSAQGDRRAAEVTAGARPAPSVGQRIAETVEADLGGVPLRLEVADDPEERRIGLMGRDEVPAGTGMLFLFGEQVRSSFWMFQVEVPLTAVFLRDDVVVHVALMEPCREADSSRCPAYGPDEPFDTVVETAPETLPGVQVGDRLEIR
jgi:uncharacterized protein